MGIESFTQHSMRIFGLDASVLAPSHITEMRDYSNIFPWEVLTLCVVVFELVYQMVFER